jgi:hypothetical protein
MEWYTSGNWMVHDDPNTASCHLEFLHEDPDWIPKHCDGTPITRWYPIEFYFNRGAHSCGEWRIPDYAHKNPIAQRAVTFEEFKDMHFDVFVSSMTPHVPIFNRLIKEYHPNAKHIFQAGNNYSYTDPNWTPDVRNLLLSAKGINIPDGANVVYYHQEFDLDEFQPKEPFDRQSVVNLQNVMCYPELFNNLQMLLPDWDFAAYGIRNPNGPITHRAVPSVLMGAGFLFHCKRVDDGYGHCLHTAFACGKPCIVKSEHYKGCTAEALFEHGQTVIDLSKISTDDAAYMLKDAVQNYPQWSSRVRKKFEEVVDFDSEEEEIRKFLERLQ